MYVPMPSRVGFFAGGNHKGNHKGLPLQLMCDVGAILYGCPTPHLFGVKLVLATVFFKKSNLNFQSKILNIKGIYLRLLLF
jgi:hypothetical protein